ncbi:19191_t:CDS:2 [Gigaspora margarita]|uniref:19191_t:CDS:1 n=1 Tax=Gigaspora margarita TaxID=4874 RepID=A0ABN7V4A0_GIGMA|nr:19191_t:CDS:2 [Gigaspora margarita]
MNSKTLQSLLVLPILQETCLDALRWKLGLRISIVQPEISTKILYNLQEQTLNDQLWEELEKLASFLIPFVQLICLFESGESLLSRVHYEWQIVRESVNNFKMRALDLVDKRLNLHFTPQ